jgi:hypothetical protein
MEVLEPDIVEELFRFALLLSGQRAAALDLVCDAVSEVEARSAQWREGDHRFHWALHRIFSQWKPGESPAESAPLADAEILSVEGLDVFLATLEPPSRACAALQMACDLPESAVARLLGEGERVVQGWMREFGAAVEGWRIPVKAWSLNDAERDRLHSSLKARPRARHRFERFLGVIAVLTGALVLCGWVAWERWSDTEPSRVRAELEQLLETADRWKNEEWNTFEGSKGEVEDWLFLNGLEGARIPHRLAEVPPTAGRVVRWRETHLAQIISVKPKSLIWVVPAQALGVFSPELRAGRVSAGRWSGDWTIEGAYVVLVASTTDAP